MTPAAEADALRLLALLVAGHLLADFAFQTRRMVAGKDRPGWLALHGLLVGLVHAVVAIPFLSPAAGLVLLALAIAHAAVDRIKAATSKGALGPFLADQAAHLVLVAGAWLAWLRLPDYPGPLLTALAPFLREWATAALLAGVYAFNWTGGMAIVGSVLDRHHLDDGAAVDEEERSRGRTIGVLERLTLVTLVLIGEWGALGLVLAAKSIARFKDLDVRDFSERYLIGTLTSVLVAIASGLALGVALRALP